MEKIALSLIRSFIFFGRSFLGCLNSPYFTFRKLAGEKAQLNQTIYVVLFIFLYFAWVATIRTGLQTPFLLTVKLNILLLASLLGFTGMVGLIFISGRIVGGRGSLRQIYMLWIYTYVPTLVWFFSTSILYLFLPPPRSMSILGKLYSVVFIAFSISVLLWKIILYYLTLRFSLKLDLWRIIQVSGLILPAILIYSLLMYRWGVFRIPFI